MKTGDPLRSDSCRPHRPSRSWRWRAGAGLLLMVMLALGLRALMRKTDDEALASRSASGLAERRAVSPAAPQTAEKEAADLGQTAKIAPVPAPAVDETPVLPRQPVAAGDLGGVKASPLRSVQKPAAAITEKLSLQPLPASPPAAVTGQFQNTERDARIADLLKQAASAKDPRVAHRSLLTAAAHQVGKGDWVAAKGLYDQIVAESKEPGVLSAVERNLQIVNQTLAIRAEPDLHQQERLKLELAQTHLGYGHRKAARRIWQELEKTTKQPEVREEAARQQAALNPPEPPALPPFAKGEPK